MRRLIASFAGDRLGKVLLAVLGLYYLFEVTAPLCDATRQIGLRRFHQRLPFAVWAAMQPASAMYSFENRVTGTFTNGERPFGPSFIIHHPMRVPYTYNPPAGRFVLTSTFSASSLTSTYDVGEDHRVTLVVAP